MIPMIHACMLTLATLAPATSEVPPSSTADEPNRFGDEVWRSSGGFRLAPASAVQQLSLRPPTGAWQPFRILGQGALGTWSLMGTVAGARPACVSGVAAGCSPFAEAGVALGWRPRRSLVTFFGGLKLTSRAVGGAGSGAPAPTVMGGVSVALPSMVDVVNAARGLSPTGALLSALGVLPAR